jgi:hypothetical protein
MESIRMALLRISPWGSNPQTPAREGSAPLDPPPWGLRRPWTPLRVVAFSFGQTSVASVVEAM